MALVSAFSLAPFLGFLNDNRMELPSPRQVLQTGLLTALLALVVLYLLLVIRPQASADRLAVCIALFVVCFFNFYRVFDTSPPIANRWLQLVLWSVATSAVVALAWRLSASEQVVFFLLLLGVCLCAFSLFGYLAGRPDDDVASSAPDVPEPTASTPSPADRVDLPNVYYFMLDEYARADQMQEVVGLDNNDFLDSMRQRDFTVGDESFSSYTKTLLSMPSVLDMRYVADEESGLPGGILQYDDLLRGDNETVRRFEELGYEYVYSPTGAFDWTECDETADQCIEVMRSGLALDELDVALLRLTPVGSLLAANFPTTDPVYVLDELDELGPELSEPFFLFAHILNPHGPQRYDKDCSLRTEFHFRAEQASEADIEAYAQDVRCLNELVLEAVDRILEKDPTAIIVVQGDHGTNFLPGATMSPKDWDEARYREIFGTLDAIHLPPECEQPAARPRSTVNTFRIVFACVEGEEVEYLEDRAFTWQSSSSSIEEVDDPQASLTPKGSD